MTSEWERRTGTDGPIPSSSDLLDLAAELYDAAEDRRRRPELLRTTPRQVAARLGRPLTTAETAFVADVLESACALCRALSEAEDAVVTAEAGLEATRTGVIAVDSSGVVTYVNATAARLLNAAPGACHDMVTRAARALADAADDAVFRDAVSVTRTLEFRRASEPAGVGILGFAPAPALLVTVVDTAASPSVATIARALRLTPAEARLCAELARGCTVAEAAGRLGIKMSTARSQLSSTFAKTETRRQAQLMTLLASLPIDLD